MRMLGIRLQRLVVSSLTVLLVASWTALALGAEDLRREPDPPSDSRKPELLDSLLYSSDHHILRPGASLTPESTPWPSCTQLTTCQAIDQGSGLGCAVNSQLDVAMGINYCVSSCPFCITYGLDIRMETPLNDVGTHAGVRSFTSIDAPNHPQKGNATGSLANVGGSVAGGAIAGVQGVGDTTSLSGGGWALGGRFLTTGNTSVNLDGAGYSVGGAQGTLYGTVNGNPGAGGCVAGLIGIDAITPGSTSPHYAVCAIGDQRITGQVVIEGGTPATDRVLTAVDGTGRATWKDLTPLINHWVRVGGDTLRPTSFSNDKVRLGTQVPTGPNADYRLSVDGKLVAKSIVVNITDWADFVFASGYPLPSLQHVEDYVRANGHLPGIPSKEEVRERGVDLGKMDALLLQKVEELTLYVIEQRKELQALRGRQAELDAENSSLRSKLESASDGTPCSSN